MGSPKVNLYHEHVLVKEPGTKEKTPWHHDQPYYPIDGEDIISFWIPLDPVGQRTCPEYIAGSHRWGRWFIPARFADRKAHAAAQDARFVLRSGFMSPPPPERDGPLPGAPLDSAVFPVLQGGAVAAVAN